MGNGTLISDLTAQRNNQLKLVLKQNKVKQLSNKRFW